MAAVTSMVRSVVPDAAATRRPAGLAAAHAAVPEARALDASVLIRGGGTKLRRTPARTAASGNRRQRVGFVTGCVQEVFFGDVNAATVQVLVAQGCEVVAPRVQGCCGALELHGGREAAALRRARRLVDVFSEPGPGCDRGQRRGLLLGAEGLRPATRRRPSGRRTCCRVRRQGLRCHRDPGGPAAPAAVPAANELGRRKAETLAAAGADVIVTTNPGCALQIGRILGRPVQHPVQVLAAALDDTGGRGDADRRTDRHARHQGH